MTARVAVVVFPGSNCEYDVARAIAAVGGTSSFVWHTERSLEGFDAVVLPGGFAHGDYLRPGAIARFSPIMDAVAEVAAAGRPVLGICNGFQVLTEAGLLPGALQKNEGLTFLCEPTDVLVYSTRSVLTAGMAIGDRLSIPINHFSGAYVCDLATYQELETTDRIVLRYVHNPNGSYESIAGICNEAGNVVGLMPHPERASSVLLGGVDGLTLLANFVGAALAVRG
jgi:phosphoribosylformylglycinamidine synthase